MSVFPFCPFFSFSSSPLSVVWRVAGDHVRLIHVRGMAVDEGVDMAGLVGFSVEMRCWMTSNFSVIVREAKLVTQDFNNRPTGLHCTYGAGDDAEVD